MQFLPDVDIPCPACRGSRYSKDADDVRFGAAKVEGTNLIDDSFTLPELMDADVKTAIARVAPLPAMKLVAERLRVLDALGLGYLTLGEATPNLSGGEAQRLKLASEMGRLQDDAVFVFDEPTIGLHPLDVRTLLAVFKRLISLGATVIVIEHDLDLIRSADYIVDMGPEGGEAGGRVVVCGTPDEVRACKESRTGRYI